MPNVSVVIVTYGEFKYTSNCLRCLSSPDDHLIDEFIIIDTLPPPWKQDETQTELESLSQANNKYKIHTLDPGTGSLAALNYGLTKCQKNNDVFITGNDIFMGEGGLQALINCAYDIRWKDLVGFVGPYIAPEVCLDSVISKDFRDQYFTQWYDKFLSASSIKDVENLLDQLYDGDFELFSRKFVQRHQGHVYDIIHGAACYIRRDILNKFPTFEEPSDVDMWIRVEHAGLFNIMTM